MEGLSELSKLVYWGLGACITGFLFLCGWLAKLQASTGEKINIMSKEMSEKVTYKWLEEKFEKELKEGIKELRDVLQGIHSALSGDMEKPGIISRLRDVEREVEELKAK